MHTINFWLGSSARYIRARFHDIYFLRKITFWVFLFWILFTVFLSIQALSPNLALYVLWIIFISTTLLSVCLWQASTQEIPKAGLVIFVILVLFIYLSYIIVTRLGGNGSEFTTLGIVVLIDLLLTPLSYVVGRRIKFNEKILNNVLDYDSITTYLPKRLLVFLTIGLGLAIFGIFTTIAYSQKSILGWDTVTYVFRARLLEIYGINAHAKIWGGYNILFPALSLVFHKITQLSYLDIVRFLTPLLVTLICLSTGYWAYVLSRSWLLMFLTALFTAGWTLVPELISDLRDNLMVFLVGIWAMIIFTQLLQKKTLWREVVLGCLLILTGISHISICFIFFIIILQVNFMEFYEIFWLGGKKDLFRLLWQAIRIPLISGIFVLVIWSPVVLDYIKSLSLGLVTGQEATGNALVNSTTWIMNSYDLYMSIPWIILGFIEIIWLIPITYRNRSLKIIFAWSTLCIVWGILLAPLSYLSSRFLMMAPIWILIPFGMVRVLQMTQNWRLWQRAIQQILLLAVVFGVVLPGNIFFNVKKLNYEMYHVSIETFQRINYVNQFISTEHAKPPYIFLAEKSTSDSVAFSSLWRVILLSTLPDQALTNSYLYFGTLNHLLKKEPTPPTAEGLPAVDQASFAASSKLWFDLLTKYKVFNSQEMTIFIMKEYNPDTFDQYLYLPEVDSIGPDILVINVPDDLKY